jgi:hypothetical protein
MNDLSELRNPAMTAMCWRISFAPAGSKGMPDSLSFITIREPRHVFAIFEQENPDSVLSDSNARGKDDLLIIWLPRTAARSMELEMRAEEWVRGGARAEQPLIRASIRTVLVLWSENRAVIHADINDLQSSLDAVLRFTLVARETLALEQQSAAVWPEIESHLDLTHDISHRQLHLQSKVNSLTEQATRMNVICHRLNLAMQQFDRTLPTISKLLFSELALQANLEDRIETIEHPIEFFMDHCELSNDRLIDSRFNRRLLFMECGILLVLCAELFTFVIEVSSR